MGRVRPLDPRLLRHARSARVHIIVSAALGLATAALVIVQALLISHAVSPVVLGTDTLSGVLPLVAALVCVVAARAGVVALREALSHRAAEGAIRELRAAVLTRAEELGPRWRARHGADTATLVTRGLDDLVPYFVKFLPQLLLVVTVTPLALGTILVLDFWSAFIAAAVIPLIPLFMVLIGRFTQESSARKLSSMERLGSQLLDLMAGLPTLRGLGREDGPREHLRRLGRENTRATMSTLRVAFLSGGVLEFLTTLSVALVAVEVGMRLVHGSIPLTTGLVVIMLAPEVFEPLRQVGAQFHASANGVAAAQAAFEVIETPVPPHGDTPAPDPATTDIVLEGLSVAARGVWAPADLSAVIHPGTVVALTGPSGSGKTTTVMVLLGLEPATRGRVLLRPLSRQGQGGDEDTAGLPTGTPSGSGREVDLAEVALPSWWSHATWVPQAPTILPGTLRENVLGEGDGPGSAADLDAAARATGFDQVVGSLEEGWDTRVGQGGTGLSVGQRQRLALTRALLDDSPLVVLDEPTAHLDAVSEGVVVDTILSMRRAGRTVVVIAHREAVVAAADQVIEVPTRRATTEETEQWPALVEVEGTEDLHVDLPGLLDPSLVGQAPVGQAPVEPAPADPAADTRPGGEATTTGGRDRQ
ncbi:thiol reductant ABC exporter subunit CydD [Actinomyces polynesiensis]|uniref:thiol reductant ABC exporter subunit CydD n=1 Tax=Actinomyces polynesiensis TaxID=1325934 RepID=UPI00093DF6A6